MSDGKGKKLPISVVISAVDNVTYRVMAINERLKRITAPVGKVRAAFATLGDEAGLGRLAKGLGQVGSTGREFFRNVAGDLAKISAVGVAAGAAVYGITRAFALAGDEIATVSARLGISTRAFQELAYAAEQSDVDQAQFTQALDKFNKGIGETAAGTGEAIQGFHALGISVRDSRGRLRSMEDLLPEVAARLGSIRSESLRAAVASKLFGREGAKLNGIFSQGAEGLAKLRKEAHDVGAVMDDSQIAAAEAFDNGMKSVMRTLLMVRNVIGAALAPKIVELGRQLQTHILANREKIAAFAAAFAERLPVVIRQLITLFSTLGRIVAPLVAVVGWLADTFGEVAVAVGALLLWLGPTIVSFFQFAAAIAKVVGPALKVAWVGFTLVFGAIKALVVALAALVGWPLVIAGAFISAALLIWKYWKPISEFFSKTWEKIRSVFGSKKQFEASVSGDFKLGEPLGAMQTVDAAARSSTQRNESLVQVSFDNLPRGTRVESKKTDVPLDLSMGYSMAAP